MKSWEATVQVALGFLVGGLALCEEFGLALGYGLTVAGAIRFAIWTKEVK